MQISASPVCFLHISMFLLMNAILFQATSGVYLLILLLMLVMLMVPLAGWIMCLAGTPATLLSLTWQLITTVYPLIIFP